MNGQELVVKQPSDQEELALTDQMKTVTHHSYASAEGHKSGEPTANPEASNPSLACSRGVPGFSTASPLPPPLCAFLGPLEPKKRSTRYLFLDILSFFPSALAIIPRPQNSPYVELVPFGM